MPTGSNDRSTAWRNLCANQRHFLSNYREITISDLPREALNADIFSELSGKTTLRDVFVEHGAHATYSRFNNSNNTVIGIYNKTTKHHFAAFMHNHFFKYWNRVLEDYTSAHQHSPKLNEGERILADSQLRAIQNASRNAWSSLPSMIKTNPKPPLLLIPRPRLCLALPQPPMFSVLRQNRLHRTHIAIVSHLQSQNQPTPLTSLISR